MNFDYKAILKRQLLTEADEAPLPDELPLEDDAMLETPAGQEEAAAAVLGGQENLDALTPKQDVIDRYIQAQQISDKLDDALVTQLVNRIEEIDAFVERLGGLSEDSLLSMLKRGAETNDTIEDIYSREHRSLGKVSSALSALSQNLKSYI